MIDERRIGSCAGFAHDIIRLPSEARVDHDHEALLHDIIRLPSEARVDHDHEALLHDIIRKSYARQVSSLPASR